jgi:hypothetical protein
MTETNKELKTRIKMALPSSYPHVQALTALATQSPTRRESMRQVPLRPQLQPPNESPMSHSIHRRQPG